MFFILAATFLAGAVATKVLLELGYNRLWVRYALAVVIAYIVFLGLIKLWLLYVKIRSRREEGLDPLDLVDFPTPSGSAGEVFQPAGGSFGGGGASGSFGSTPSNAAIAKADATPEGLFSLDLDEGVLLVVLATLVLGLFAAGAYVVWLAPVLLSEAAFEALLAASLVKRTRQIDRPDWVGSVVRATVVPFAIALFVSAAAGGIAQNRCPEATKLVQAIECNTSK